MTDSAFEQLLDHLDQWAVDPSVMTDPETLRTLLEAGQADRSIDRELHVDDTVRWLVGIVVGAHHVLEQHDDDTDDDLAELRRIVTRWLHPARRDA